MNAHDRRSEVGTGTVSGTVREIGTVSGREIGIGSLIDYPSEKP